MQDTDGSVLEAWTSSDHACSEQRTGFMTPILAIHTAYRMSASPWTMALLHAWAEPTDVGHVLVAVVCASARGLQWTVSRRRFQWRGSTQLFSAVFCSLSVSLSLSLALPSAPFRSLPPSLPHSLPILSCLHPRCFISRTAGLSLMQGTLTLPDGAVYEGQFKNGKKHGVAKCACLAS